MADSRLKGPSWLWGSLVWTLLSLRFWFGKEFAGGVGTGQTVHSCREEEAEREARSTNRADKRVEDC